MTTVRTTCPGCEGREVDLGVESILLILDQESGDEVPAGSYAFQCPECGEVQHKFAEPKVAALLLAAGVRDDWGDASGT
jgi:hypothetical protein